MVSLSNHEAPEQNRPAWRRTPRQRRIADFRRFLIRNRLLVRLAAVSFLAGVVAGAIVLGLPRALERSLEFVKTAFGTSAGLKVTVITVEGLKHLSQDDVAQALAISPQTSLLDVDVASARDRLLKLGWVKDATILRVPPNRLHVVITEYEPRILWQSHGRSFVADDAGRLISPAEPNVYGALFHVTGDDALSAAPELMKRLDAMPQVNNYVQFAERVGRRRWNLHLSNQLVVELPDQGLDAALAALTHMITTEDLLSRDIVAVDLRDLKVPRLRLGDDALRALHLLPGNS